MSNRQENKYGLITMLILCIIAVTAINYNLTLNHVVKSVDKESEFILERMSEESSEYIAERIANMRLMADYLSFIHSNDDLIVTFLNRQKDSLETFESLSYITKEGRMLTAQGRSMEIPDRESVNLALSSKEPIYSDVFEVEPDVFAAAIRFPVMVDEEVVGVISGTINAQEMMSNVSKGLDISGQASLSANQRIIVSTANDLKVNAVIPFSDIFLGDMEAHVEGRELVNEQDAHFIKYNQVVPNWYVVLDTYSSESQQAVTFLFWRNYLFIAGGVLALLTIYLLLKKYKIRKERLLKQDLLTGLSNRVQLEEDLKEAFEKKSKSSLYVILINIDRFKNINDRFGYQSGDRVLYELSRMVQTVVSSNQLYRVGADEFVLTAYSNSEEQIYKTMDSILKSADRPVILPSGESLWMTISIGIRHYEKGVSSDVLLQDASLAVQHAKGMGGNRYVLFTKELSTQHERVRLMEKNLATALQNNEFHLVYQPLYLLQSEKITGYEALLRWNSPALGEISPVEFVPVLESTDLIIPVGRWVMHEVAQTVNRWEQETEEHFQVGINISIKQLMHPEFINDVKSLLKETSVSTDKLLFEITESVAVQNSVLALSILNELNALGIQTALDDFGTGYSSLSILKTLPIQHLKVDRSFIMIMESDGDKSKMILKGIIDIAKGLGLNTVMEGVETIEQLTLLKEMGAEKIQGYLISKPVLPRKALALRSVNYFKAQESK
ncbi:putative bifunctional diguanylate cyclase/phosphodiesterase [Chungangia koreensis]|uniref:Bifunctional diguanylate cyclase/phosphodiesterase n=1 Tax=Chungangia koreensis TaxID=752657 RepID=A0ABV8X4Q8_9LACT